MSEVDDNDRHLSDDTESLRSDETESDKSSDDDDGACWDNGALPLLQASRQVSPI